MFPSPATGSSLHGSQAAETHWLSQTQDIWLQQAPSPTSTHFIQVASLLANVPKERNAVLDLSNISLPSFPHIFQPGMVLTEDMKDAKKNWCAPSNNPDKPEPWSNLPGLKVIYPHILNGLNTTCIQNRGLGTHEVWLIQRFLQRLYALENPNEFQAEHQGVPLNAMNMDQIFAEKPIYDWSHANLNASDPNSLLLPGHFFNTAHPLHIAHST